MKKNKIRKQLKALKALAEGNANPHEAAVAAEKLREFEELLSASSVRGIFEKVSGSGVWWIRYTDAAGKYRREKVGAYGLAVKLLDKRRGEAITGKKLPETLRRKFVPFAELADACISYVEKKYARPADDVARLKVIKDWFPCAADAVTPDMIEEKLEEAQESNKWSASTRNHYHNLISKAFRLALRKGTVNASPIHLKVSKLKEDNGHVRFLTAEEEKQLRAAIRSKPEWASHEVELTFALATGLRRSSMYIELTWENVDLLGRTLSIQRTKSGSPITIPLNADAMEALMVFRSRGDGTGRVVRNEGGETLLCNAHWFREAVQASGIAPFRWHDCRHHFASMLRQSGVALETIADLLGHSPKTGLMMTKRYAHLSIANLHEAVGRISKTISPTAAPSALDAPPKEASIQ
jgi:integrase